MNDSTRRAIRTGFDVVLAVLAGLGAVFLLPGMEEAFKDMGLGGKLGTFSLIVLALTTIVNKVKNALEDSGTIPAVLKAQASDGANPTPNPGGPVL